jgi:hypothetical protein
VTDQLGDRGVGDLVHLLADDQERVADRDHVAVAQDLFGHAHAVDQRAVAAALVDQAQRPGRAGVDGGVMARRLAIVGEAQAALDLATDRRGAAQRAEHLRRRDHLLAAVDQMQAWAPERGQGDRRGLLLGGGHAA